MIFILEELKERALNHGTAEVTLEEINRIDSIFDNMDTALTNTYAEKVVLEKTVKALNEQIKELKNEREETPQ